MTIFLLSFIKELLSTINTKLYIANRDILAAIGCGIASFLGELKGAYVYSIPFTSAFLLKAFWSSLAILLASLVAIPLTIRLLEISFIKKYTIEKDKPYEYIIRFKDIKTCEFIDFQLKEKGIKTYFKEHSKKLIIDSRNKNESRIIEKIIDNNYKTLKVHELKDYRKLN